jgi:hypothetical protein
VVASEYWQAVPVKLALHTQVPLVPQAPLPEQVVAALQ